MIKGSNIRSKSRDIEEILHQFGGCSFEYTILKDELMFYFEDERNLQDLIRIQDCILKRINNLFIDNIKESND